MSLETHLLYALRNATVKPWPFPHFYVQDVFPLPEYFEIIEYLAVKGDYSLSGSFKNRSFAEDSHLPGLDFMHSREFMRAILGIFAPQAKQRFAGRNAELTMDLRLVRDGKGYQIGPHTDARWKVVSLLFYLPPIGIDEWHTGSHLSDKTLQLAQYGTSIYLPKDRNFTCEGGPHHKFDGFERIWTAPYLPNSCFGFWKTNQSFHGVEPVDVEFDRDVLLFNLYERQALDASHNKKA